MRIKKTRILSMLMTMVLLSSTVLPIYAEASAESDVTYCYSNDFNTEQDFSRLMSGGTEYSQIIDEETREGYVKIGYKQSDKAAQFTANFDEDKTAVKSMFIELDLSAPEAGLPQGIIRIGGLTSSSTNETDIKTNDLIYLGGNGVYLTKNDRTNGNEIATIPQDKFVKVGLLLNVESDNRLQYVDVYVYNDTSKVWAYVGTGEFEEKKVFEYTEFKKIYVFAAKTTDTTELEKGILFDNLKAYYVASVTSVNSTPYSVQATVTETTNALAQSTTGNVVVKLLDDIELGKDVLINEGVTLDLNGYTLNMGEKYLLSNGNVVDNSTDKAGRLKIATEIVDVEVDGNTKSVVKPKGKLAAGNSQMPVYDTQKGGYVFAGIVEKVKNNTELDSDVFDLIFRPSFDINNTLLAAGGEAARVKVIIRLEWTKDGTPMDPVDLAYTDEDIQAVYAGDNTAFYIKASGIQSVDDLKITPMVVSDLGVEWSYSSFSYFKVTK